MTPVSDETPDDFADVRYMLGRLEAKLDVALAQHGARLDEHGRRIDDHELRIRVVEKNAISLPAALAFAATVAAIVGAAIPLIDRLSN